MTKQPFEIRAGMYHDREPDEVVRHNQEVLAEFAKARPVNFPLVEFDEGTTILPMPEGTRKSLISLEDWNNRKVQAKPEICWNGIACPECGKELFDSTPSCVLCCNPPRVGVACACGFHGSRLV